MKVVNVIINGIKYYFNIIYLKVRYNRDLSGYFCYFYFYLEISHLIINISSISKKNLSQSK